MTSINVINSDTEVVLLAAAAAAVVVAVFVVRFQERAMHYENACSAKQHDFHQVTHIPLPQWVKCL